MTQTLHQILTAASPANGPEFYQSRVPSFIYANLKVGFGPRPYQAEAFGRFIYYLNEYLDRPKNTPNHLLYHMATGSGKTLVMAGLILYLYTKGYRNFLFFVNSANIIDKTRVNFLDATASKYLFSPALAIGDKQIQIKEVANFQAANPGDINIVFSTIQGLHTQLHTPRENSLTYADFADQKMVLISDEAHHINAATKKGRVLGSEENAEITSWEGTVNRIFNAHASNILLEFTATVDLSVPEILNKYQDKLIFDYSLKQFRQEGYSKEVKVLQADVPPFSRALQGVILSQYRRKIFENYKIPVKPIILFKSKTIKESQAFRDEFITGIKNLKVADLEKIKHASPDEAIKKVFRYLEASNISLEDFILELKEDFVEDKIISVNSKEESEQKQLAVNTLEDEANAYRAVLAVDKLNEGWDVLNLFDIVRLYNTRDGKAGKPGKTTMAEAQLIGRGARYYPFRINGDQPYFKRKFDDNITHELRICEELYYHSAYNPRYIQELNTALEEIGIKAEQKAEQNAEKPNDTEKNPAGTSLTKSSLLYPDEQPQHSRGNRSPRAATFLDQTYKVNLYTGYTKSVDDFGNSITTAINTKEQEYKLKDFGEHIIRKAINKLAFYQFSNLKSLFPHLHSVSEFIAADAYLGQVKVKIMSLPDQIGHLSPQEKLDVALKVLEEIAANLAIDKS